MSARIANTGEPALPFFSKPIPSEAFAGRETERSSFESLTVRKHNEQHDTFVWVVEGNKDLGKSTFLQWCQDRIDHYNTSQKKRSNKRVVVCRYTYPKDSTVTAPQFFRTLYSRALWQLKFFSLHPLWMYVERLAYVVTGLAPSVKDVELQVQGVTFQMSAERLAHRLMLLLRGTGKHIDAFVFLIDEVSSQANSKSVDHCAALANALSEMKFGQNAPNVGLVLAMLPDWREYVSGAIHPQKHITKTIKLKPLKESEVRDCIRKALDYVSPVKWDVDGEFTNTMSRLSGGLPKLIQSIGRRAAAKAAASRTITSSHLRTAVLTDEVVRESLKAVWYSAGSVPALDRHVAREILERLADKKIVSDEAASKGLSESAWRQVAIANTGGARPNYDETFQTIWDHLQTIHVVDEAARQTRSEERKFRFAALAIRSVLPHIIT